MRNGDLRLLSVGTTHNIRLEAENGALRESVELQLDHAHLHTFGG
ncbi:hypothetical protein [Nocardiopsis ganjiahuensis]|nr:hypothetical protein [Nocardiopsis ganjiahuensis]